MTEEQKFVQELCPNAKVVRLDCAISDGKRKGHRWVGSLNLEDGSYDKLYRSPNNADEVWQQLKRKVDFLILQKLGA